ncbi:MAG: 6-bladed beta-propeller [Acidobacteriota bacterium]|nr:6-bladed beta-propeller [Acidobacteriota bacterium]
MIGYAILAFLLMLSGNRVYTDTLIPAPKALENWDELIKQYDIKSPLLKGNPAHLFRVKGKDAKLIPKNIVDEPVEIRRFTRSVAQEYWDKDIFGEIGAILVMSTPAGRMTLVCDPFWARVIWMVQGSADIYAFFGGENRPTGIAGKFPNIFISDSRNSRVAHYKIEMDGSEIKNIEFVKYIGGYYDNEGLPVPYAPHGIAYSDNGTPSNLNDDVIYVADLCKECIYKFDIAGNWLSSFCKNLEGPIDVAVGKQECVNTKDIFVADWLGDRVIAYCDTSEASPSLYQFDLDCELLSIDVDCYGYPYVTDEGNDRIIKLRKDVEDTLWSYGRHGFGDGHFNSIHSIYIIQDELFATEKWTNSSGISYYWIEKVTDTIPPVVRILSPPDTTYINGEIKIVGTAKDEYLKYWQVYQGEGEYPDTFELIDWDTEGKECAVLTEWDTQSLSGIYSILLLARDEGGNLSTDTLRIWVGEPPVDLAIGKRGFDNGEFRLPVDVAVDDSNKIYLTDTQNDRVQKFSSDGSFLLSFGKHGKSSGEFMKPSGIESKGDEILVADINNSRIQIFNQEGEYLSEFGDHGSGNREFNHPFDLAIYNENIFVSDRNNHRIQKFTGDGGFISTFGSHGSDSGEFNNPSGIDIMNEEIAVADRENDRVQILSLDGELKKIIQNNFDRPYDVGFDSDSSLYVVDCNKHRVQKFDRYGNKLLSIYDDSLKLAKGCCMRDALWVTDTHNNRALKFPGWFHLSNKSIFSLLKKNNSISCLYPNPCSQNTNIYLLLPEKIETEGKGKGKSSEMSRTSHSVKLSIYDLTGRRVKQLYRGTINGSQHIFQWGLEDKKGRKVPSGCYFYHLQVDNKIEDNGKIVVVK